MDDSLLHRRSWFVRDTVLGLLGFALIGTPTIVVLTRTITLLPMIVVINGMFSIAALAALALLHFSRYRSAVGLTITALIGAITASLLLIDPATRHEYVFLLSLPVVLAGVLLPRRGLAIVALISIGVFAALVTQAIERQSITTAIFSNAAATTTALILALLWLLLDRYGRTPNDQMRLPLERQSAHEPDATPASGKVARLEAALESAYTQLHAVLTNAPAAAIQIYDRDGIVRFWNPASERLYGFTAEQVIGQRLAGTVLSEPDAAEFERMIKTILASNEAAPLREWQTHTATGESRWIISSLFPICDGESEGRVVCMDLDITQQKRTETMLRKNEEQFRSFIRSCPLDVAMLDRELRYLAVSDRWLQTYGKSREELIGLRHYDVVSDLPERWRAIHQQCLEGVEAHSDEDVFIHDDGRVEWLRWQVSPWWDRSGSIGGIIIFSEDITDHKRAEEHQRILTTLSTLLSTTLDAQKVVQHVLRISVRSFADCCVIRLSDDDGQFRLVEALHADPAKAHLMEQLRRHLLEYGEQWPPIAYVLQTGKPWVSSPISEQFLSETTITHGHLAAIDALNLRSIIVMPIVSRGTLRGCVSFVRAASSPLYTSEDVVLAEEITRRVSQAMDNALLYQEAQDAVRRKDEAFQLLDTLLATAPIGLGFLDRELRIARANHSLSAMLGIPIEACIGRSIQELLPANDDSITRMVRRVLDTGQPVLDQEVMCDMPLSPWDSNAWIVNFYPVRDHRQQITGIGLVINDITERKQLETQLAQASKMESIGRLAGGIAHDFNNLLTIIGASTEMARRSLPEQHPAAEDMRSVQQATEQAASLTRQLLAFARRQRIEPTAVSLNMIVTRLLPLIQRLLSEQIVIETNLDPQLPLVRADSGQIEQVLINLVINARDAMPNGGRLTIASRNAVSDITDAQTGQPQRRAFACLSIGDTGIGMDEYIQRHVFEPFFTTKQLGNGTGLGLATSYGIITQHGGTIDVYSQPQRGTTFTISLPAIVESADAGAAQSA